MSGTGWLRRLAGYLLQHRTDLGLAFGGATFGGAAQVAVPLVERHIVDHVVGGDASLWPWLTLLLVLAGLTFFFFYLRRYRGGKVALGVQLDLRNDMQAHLQAMDFANLDRMPTGQLVARANSDSALVQGLLMLLPVMSGNVLFLLLAFGVMVFLSPLLSLVTLLLIPALLVVSYRMRQQTFPATWDAQQREGELVQIVDEDVSGVRVVKAFGQSRRELDKVAEAAGVVYGSQLRAVRIQSRYQPALQAIPTLGQVAVLALGGTLALHGDLSLGTFLAFSTYVAQLIAPARQLAGVLTIGQQARAGLERIFQLLDLEPAVVDGPDELGPVEGAIRFEGVTFGYDDGPTVLSGLDLTIAPGERVALVGASGSGKSTVTQLVSRFYDPLGGRVLVDGHDVRDLRLSSLRSQVGVVFEEAFLFSDTVYANIAYGRPDATVEEVHAAARVAQADGFVTALPAGYDTVVGERGLTLSGGQRQRIALARAIVKDPRILVLDDATSAVDATTEEAINSALRTVLAGRTTLLVAHRRSTLHLADRVVVLEQGRVLDQGTHEELTERSAVYRGLLTGLEEDVVHGQQQVALGNTTAEAWNRKAAPRAAVTNTAAPSIGAGLGGGGGGAWRMNLAATPELLAKVAKLRPVRDTAEVDVGHESRPRGRFSLGTLLSEFRWPLLLGLVFVIGDALASLAGPVLIERGLQHGVRDGSYAALYLAAALLLVITLADLVDEVAQTFVTGRVAQRVMLSLRLRIFGQLQRLSLDYYEREMAGRIMTRMTTDVDQFESLVENGLLAALVAGVTFIGVGIALVVYDVELGLLTLAVVPPLAVATVVFRRKASHLYEVARDRVAVVNADFQESLSGVRESQAFTHEAATVARFHGLGNAYLQTRVQAQRLVATYFPFVGFLSSVADAIVLGVGAGLVRSGHLTTAVLIAFILYVDLFFSPVQQLSQVFDAWQQTRISVGRISDLMALQTLTPEAENPVVPGRLRGEVVLDDVRFAYPLRPGRAGGDAERRGPQDAAPPVDVVMRSQEALQGLSLTIAPGETVALVGETGAGKSTVLKLLARFYDPEQGSVRVDGHDLRTLDLEAFRSQLGYVPQEAFLFTGTVRDNIAYGRPGASDAEVEAAARAVGAHDFVAQLAGGYHQEISERGRSLSGGQRQLIALARAELVDPVLLLLDEATSNLDLATEARVAEAMQRVSRNRTTVVIAHRLQKARAADRIVVLAGGRIAEVGSHDDLLERGGRYAAMWNAFEQTVLT